MHRHGNWEGGFVGGNGSQVVEVLELWEVWRGVRDLGQCLGVTGNGWGRIYPR